MNEAGAMSRLTAWTLLFPALLLLSGCNNHYGPPANGQPSTWGEQHYLDNQRYQQAIDQQQSD
jgi:hypothetical protein